MRIHPYYKIFKALLALSCLVPVMGQIAEAAVTMSGELKQWHKVTLTLDGPQASEAGTPNPFTDYRMNVTFTHPASGKSYTVPGYFAADGNAANTSATSGNKWRAHLSPDHTGIWNYNISFRSGTNVAVDSSSTAGSFVSAYDGKSGSFEVAATDKTGRDFRGKGRLTFVGERYLQFAGSGEYFLKQGADSPENLLAYSEFDGNFKNDGHKDDLVKDWSPHVQDWQAGDPTWTSGKGKGLIGAINYLASEGLNSVSFLTMNINGDDRNVFPYTNYSERKRIDVSRMGQWAMVFEHAQKQGLFLHFKTQETENETLLDGGNTGVDRKLYYRELMARFGHNLALNWNFGEENGDWRPAAHQTTAQRRAMVQYFYDKDPYQHHRVLHNGQNPNDMYGEQSKLTGWSLQTNNQDFSSIYSRVSQILSASAQSGKIWAVACDEPGDHQYSIRPDANPGNSHVDGRKNALWGTFMAGGWGNEWYFGYLLDHDDLSLTDFRSRDKWWDYCRYALQFFNDNNVPVQDMSPDNSLTSNNDSWCLAKPGSTYVVYLKNGGTTNLDLSGISGEFTVQWYDARNGGALQNGSVTSVVGGGSVSLGSAPYGTGSDWAVLVGGEGRVTENAVTMLSKDFPYSGTNWYLDTFTDYDLLAIVPTPPDVATASVTDSFTGETGTYAITFHGVGELDGQTEFDIYVGGSLLGTTVLPLSAAEWEVGPAYNQTWNDVAVANGDVIRVVGRTATDGTEWSRARWVKLEFTAAGGTPPPPPSGVVFEEVNGLVVAEMESVDAVSGWAERSSVAGFTGTSYYEWIGGDSFNTPGNGTLEYQIKINNPGTYHFRWHSKIMNGTDTTEHNDTWLRIPGADDFFAKSGSSVKYPKGGMFVQSNNIVNGASAGGWMKVYLSGTTNWTWQARTSDNEPHQIYATFNQAGVYTVQISGRSNNHAIDRFVLFKDSLHSLTTDRQTFVRFLAAGGRFLCFFGQKEASFRTFSVY